METNAETKQNKTFREKWFNPTISYIQIIWSQISKSLRTEPQPNKPPSLANYGAFCYLNSALQGISSCDKFVEDIEKVYKENKHLEKLFVFHQLIFILNGGKVDRMELSRNQIFREWNKPGQQDSFELLAYVINQVYNEIRQTKENDCTIPKRDMQAWLKIPLPMRIIIEYKIRCDCDSIVDVPLQSDLALHVSISLKDDFDLQTLVNQFFNEDRIEDYKCGTEGCNGKGAIRYTRLSDPLPNTICIHLQRTLWNGHKMMKIDKRIKFSKLLEIKCKYRTFDNTKALNLEKEFNTSSELKIDQTNDTSCAFNFDDDAKSTLKNDTAKFTQNSLINQEPSVIIKDIPSDTSSTHPTICSEKSKNYSEVNSDPNNLNDNVTSTHGDTNNVKDVNVLGGVYINENTLDIKSTSINEDIETPKDFKEEGITNLSASDNRNCVQDQDILERSIDTENKDKFTNVHLVNSGMSDESDKENKNTGVSLSIANKYINNETAAGILHDSQLEILESETNETASGIVHDSLAEKSESSIDDVVIEKDETYHLTSVIVHYGSVYGGHYVCYKYLDGRWFLTNDSQIEKVSEQNILNCNPYILFYEKS